MIRSLAETLFDEEPRGVFSGGQIFMSAPDLDNVRRDPANGYWHCDIANEDSLTWSDKVYELFGLPAGVPIDRGQAVARYSERSKDALQYIRGYALGHDYCFILDAEIELYENSSRWIRVLAVPILEYGRVVALHGVKRAL